MEVRENLVEASAGAEKAAAVGDLAEAYRCALVMISLIHDIDFEEEVALDLAAVMDEVAGVITEPISGRRRGIANGRGAPASDSP